MEHHSPNIIGPLSLAGNAGAVGQFAQSQGAGVQAIWAASPAAALYAATDKATQVIIVGPADVTWNTPAADAISGITFNGTTGFTLPAGRLYRIDVTIRPTVAALAYTISIVDSANNPVGSLNLPISGAASLAHEHATAVFKPAVNTLIKVRLLTAVALTIGPLSGIVITTMD